MLQAESLRSLSEVMSHDADTTLLEPWPMMQIRVRCIGAEGAGHSDWSSPVSVDTPPVPGMDVSERPSATVASQVAYEGTCFVVQYTTMPGLDASERISGSFGRILLTRASWSSAGRLPWEGRLISVRNASYSRGRWSSKGRSPWLPGVQ